MGTFGPILDAHVKRLVRGGTSSTSLQGFAGKPARHGLRRALGCRVLLASQCSFSLVAHQLARLCQQASAWAHLLARFCLQASAPSTSSCTSLQGFACKPVRHQPRHAPACRVLLASQRTAALVAHLVAGFCLQASAPGPSPRASQRATSPQPRLPQCQTHLHDRLERGILLVGYARVPKHANAHHVKPFPNGP